MRKRTQRLYFLIKNLDTMTAALIWAMKSQHDLLFAQSEEEVSRHIHRYSPDFLILHDSAIHSKSIQFLFRLKRMHPSLVPIFWVKGSIRIPTPAFPVWNRPLGLPFDAWIADLAQSQGLSGTLQKGAYSLEDVLTSLNLEEATGTLEIVTRVSWGWLFMRDGIVIHAQVGRRTGEDAFTRLFIASVESPPTHVLFFHNFPKSFPRPTILKPMDALLIDIGRKFDEFRKNQ